MIWDLLLGCLVSVINIMIHAAFTVTAIDVSRKLGYKPTARPRLHLMVVMVAAVLILMLAHTIETGVWALSYVLVGVVPPDGEAVYFAFVNYCTLGYGDITPVKEWRLMGPMASMNGILMFGWSTAVLFEVLRKTIEHLGSIALSQTFSSADRD